MRYKCPHCPVECLVIDGIIESCADHPWAVPEPILEERPVEEQTLEETADGLLKR